MICPDCGSVVLQLDSEVVDKRVDERIYEHECTRCRCIIRVKIQVIKHGLPELIGKYRQWLKEGRDD